MGEIHRGDGPCRMMRVQQTNLVGSIPISSTSYFLVTTFAMAGLMNLL